MKKVMFSIIVLFILSGCATGIAPASLDKPKVASSFYLEEDVKYLDTTWGLLGEEIHVVIKKGDYNAIFENKNGTFYVGPPNNIIINGPGFRLDSLQNGGVFISKLKNKSIPKLFYFISDQGVRQGGALIDALIKNDFGRIHIREEIKDPNILQKIQVI